LEFSRRKDRAPRERRADGQMLRLLLVSELRASGEFANDLRRAGYDVTHVEATYSEATAVAAIDVACKHALPGVPLPQARRELGRRIGEQFLGTIVGQVVRGALRLMGPNRAVSRMPSYLSFGRNQAVAEAHMDGDQHWHVHFGDIAAELGEFTAGWIEAGLLRTGVKPTLVVQNVSPDEFTVDIRW
jgi:uncharacterized protein (TIGR02265 family)